MSRATVAAIAIAIAIAVGFGAAVLAAAALSRALDELYAAMDDADARDYDYRLDEPLP